MHKSAIEFPPAGDTWYGLLLEKSDAAPLRGRILGYSPTGAPPYLSRTPYALEDRFWMQFELTESGSVAIIKCTDVVGLMPLSPEATPGE